MDDTQASKLRAPFPAEMVGKLPKLSCKKCSESSTKVCSEHTKQKCRVCNNYLSTAHIDLDYIGHAATTDRLLQVDPEWTWEPMAVDATGAPVIVNGGMWIKLTVCGVTRPGFGDGKNPKEMIGDAIRNAAMRFGVALDLWAKEDLSPNGSVGDSALTERSVTRTSAEQVGGLPSPTEQKPTAAEMKALIQIVDEMLAAGHITPEQIRNSAGGEWPAVADSLSKQKCADLTLRLTTYKKNLPKVAA